MSSEVYLTDMVSRSAEQSIEEKIARLFDKSNMGEAVARGDTVAVKIHFGEFGNHRLIRPQHLRVIVQKIKELGGKPFVTDTTGIGLTSGRGTAEGCLRAAAEHGFTAETLGAPIIVADGPKGLRGVKVSVEDPVMNVVEISQAVAESDSMISVAHAKGHPRTGFAGALKNIALGCVTKCGRAPIHLAKKPWVKNEKCTACGQCMPFCPVQAISTETEGKASIDQVKCIWGCGCWLVCPEKAISQWLEMHHPSNSDLCRRIPIVFKAMHKLVGKEKIGYINMAYDVTPHCDCAPYGDTPIVPDIGILASRDPVAIDKCTIDMINASPGIPGSTAEELGVLGRGDDKLTALKDYKPFEMFKQQGGPDWKSMIKYSVENNIGFEQYRLVKI